MRGPLVQAVWGEQVQGGLRELFGFITCWPASFAVGCDGHFFPVVAAVWRRDRRGAMTVVSIVL